MNLKHAQYIMEIIKEGSITNASKTMHVSQPALSQTIKAVEKYLGAPIFLRNTNPIVLTEAGKKYIAAVKQVITISSNLLHEVADIQYEGYGTLRLGIPVQRAMQMLPAVMRYSVSAIPTSSSRSMKPAATSQKMKSSTVGWIWPSSPPRPPMMN